MNNLTPIKLLNAITHADTDMAFMLLKDIKLEEVTPLVSQIIQLLENKLLNNEPVGVLLDFSNEQILKCLPVFIDCLIKLEHSHNSMWPLKYAIYYLISSKTTSKHSNKWSSRSSSKMINKLTPVLLDNSSNNILKKYYEKPITCDYDKIDFTQVINKSIFLLEDCVINKSDELNKTIYNNTSIDDIFFNIAFNFSKDDWNHTKKCLAQMKREPVSHELINIIAKAKSIGLASPDAIVLIYEDDHEVKLLSLIYDCKHHEQVEIIKNIFGKPYKLFSMSVVKFNAYKRFYLFKKNHA